MLRGVTTAVILMLAVPAFAKEPSKYPVSAIPEALTAKAKVVIREDETVFKILSRDHATANFHFVVTIMNSNGKDYAESQVFYDKMMKVRDLKATVYDATGNVIKKLKSSEIADRSAFDGFSLYSDNRVKSFDLSQSVYPYTVDIEYEKDYSFLFFIDGSTVAGEENVSVQRFAYELIYPVDLKPRYKTYNIEGQPAVTSKGTGIESMRWTIENVTPFVIEPIASSEDYIKRIVAAPSMFEMEGYAGSMSNWQDLGRW